MVPHRKQILARGVKLIRKVLFLLFLWFGLKLRTLCMLHIILLLYCISSLRRCGRHEVEGQMFLSCIQWQSHSKLCRKSCTIQHLWKMNFLSYRMMQFFEVMPNI